MKKKKKKKKGKPYRDKTPYMSAHYARKFHRLPYPFYLLTMEQRDLLQLLLDDRTRSLRDAFRALGYSRRAPNAVVRRWMDDSAFQDAVYITLRQMKRQRRERVLDAIVRAVVCQPLRSVCDLSGLCM